MSLIGIDFLVVFFDLPLVCFLRCDCWIFVCFCNLEQFFLSFEIVLDQSVDFRFIIWLVSQSEVQTLQVGAIEFLVLVVILCGQMLRILLCYLSFLGFHTSNILNNTLIIIMDSMFL